jgi:O-glycosyl hydrolase
MIAAANANVVAAISPDQKKLVIVATNSSQTASNNVSFDLSKFAGVEGTVVVYRTSPSQDLAKTNVTAVAKRIADTLPAYSVNTYVVTLK